MSKPDKHIIIFDGVLFSLDLLVGFLIVAVSGKIDESSLFIQWPYVSI